MSCIPYPKPDAVPDWKLYNICSPASGSDHAGTSTEFLRRKWVTHADHSQLPHAPR